MASVTLAAFIEDSNKSPRSRLSRGKKRAAHDHRRAFLTFVISRIA
jgi:hypothetical protein